MKLGIPWHTLGSVGSSLLDRRERIETCDEVLIPSIKKCSSLLDRRERIETPASTTRATPTSVPPS